MENGAAVGGMEAGGGGGWTGDPGRTRGWAGRRARVRRVGAGCPPRRYFTQAGVDPFANVEWERRSAVIHGEKGEVVFEQHDVEMPKAWSQLATNVVVSKYFRGPLGTPQRETQRPPADRPRGRHDPRLGRGAGLLRDAGGRRDLRRRAHAPAAPAEGLRSTARCGSTSASSRSRSARACFILSVDDTMDSILDWYRSEGIIFKGGSGSGVNLSRIRSSKERLAGGGTASGPVSFMKAADASAGVIKSGGKTRRAAKMVVLERRPSRHRRVHPLQGRGGEEGLGADRRRLRQLARRRRPTARSSSRTPTTRCASPTSSCRRSIDDGDWQTRFVHDGEVCRDLPRARSACA